MHAFGFAKYKRVCTSNLSTKKQIYRPKQTLWVLYAAVAFDRLRPETSMRHSAKHHCMPEA